jgi:hypothetical protein
MFSKPTTQSSPGELVSRPGSRAGIGRVGGGAWTGRGWQWVRAEPLR